MAAAIESQFTGTATPMRKIEYVTTLGNRFSDTPKTRAAPSILNSVSGHALRDEASRYLCRAGVAFPSRACATS